MAIPVKKKICKTCSTPQFIFSKGQCRNCFPNKPIKSNTNKSSIGGSKSKIKRQTDKNRLLKKERAEKREVYFSYHIERCKNSEESGATINAPTRANVCHLVDKGRHPSLQSNLDNYIYLTFEEHTRFDELLFKHDFETLESVFVRAWPIACERYKKLLPLVRENTIFINKLKTYID